MQLFKVINQAVPGQYLAYRQGHCGKGQMRSASEQLSLPPLGVASANSCERNSGLPCPGRNGPRRKKKPTGNNPSRLPHIYFIVAVPTREEPIYQFHSGSPNEGGTSLPTSSWQQTTMTNLIYCAATLSCEDESAEVLSVPSSAFWP